MQALLNPGERKLSDWSEASDDFFAAFDDESELLAF